MGIDTVITHRFIVYASGRCIMRFEGDSIVYSGTLFRESFEPFNKVMEFIYQIYVGLFLLEL